MIPEELSPEAIALLNELTSGAKPVPDSPALRELFEVGFAMGNPAKAHITQQGQRFHRSLAN